MFLSLSILYKFNCAIWSKNIIAKVPFGNGFMALQGSMSGLVKNNTVVKWLKK